MGPNRSDKRSEKDLPGQQMVGTPVLSEGRAIHFVYATYAD